MIYYLIFLLETYFEENPRLIPFLKRLREANKQIFLITNSAFWYVNRGMTYLLGENWRESFDVIICQARKPSFFGAEKRFHCTFTYVLSTHRLYFRPFREIDVNKNAKTWHRVQKLEHGKVYVEVSYLS